MLIALHATTVLAGLTVGSVVLIRRKGTPWHRFLGWGYVVLLLATAIGSFGIMEVRGGRPSVFHVVSVLVGVVIVAGIVAIRRGRVWLHALLMASSVLIGVITGVAQYFDHLPFGSDALNAVVFLQVPSVLGFALIWRMAAGHRRSVG
ncbi:MAG: DUF2306 domain-containing protein [Acidimicrobiales bacterium]